MLHTHFNHPNEITGITEDAMNKLFERGITVRNQSVLQRGVNDSPETMTLLVKRLGHVNVHPYYVYVHDLVKGVEDLRTSRRHGALHREARARLDRGLQHADVRRRRARRRRQARRALVRVLRPRDRHQRLHGAEREGRGSTSSTSTRSTSSPRGAEALAEQERTRNRDGDRSRRSEVSISRTRAMTEASPRIDFETHPDRYRHWKLSFDGDVARLALDVREDGGIVPGYALKLNSYDLGVDIELADAIARIRFEHPRTRALVITSAKPRVITGASPRVLQPNARDHITFSMSTPKS